MSEVDWQNSWCRFIEQLRARFDDGLSDTEISAIYGGQRVTWVGQVVAKELQKANPGLQMQMPPVEVRLLDGRFTTVDYLYVHIRTASTHEWEAIPLESRIRFDALLSKGTGPFPGVRWADLGDGEGYISLAAIDGMFVGYAT